jgi:hypothetical protein
MIVPALEEVGLKAKMNDNAYGPPATIIINHPPTMFIVRIWDGNLVIFDENRVKIAACPLADPEVFIKIKGIVNGFSHICSAHSSKSLLSDLLSNH